MERLASGCSAIQGTACNKRVRFLVPSPLSCYQYTRCTCACVSCLSLFVWPAPCVFHGLFLSVTRRCTRHSGRSSLSHLIIRIFVSRSLSPSILIHSPPLRAPAAYAYRERYTRPNGTERTNAGHVPRLKGAETRNRLRLDSTSRPANRPQNLAEAQKNRLLLAAPSLSLARRASSFLPPRACPSRSLPRARTRLPPLYLAPLLVLSV